MIISNEVTCENEYGFLKYKKLYASQQGIFNFVRRNFGIEIFLELFT